MGERRINFMESMALKTKSSGYAHKEVRVLDELIYQNRKFPIYGIRIGTEDKSKPTFGLFGGVHGLEIIGSDIILNFLNLILNHLEWDEDLQNFFKSARLVTIPIVNPVGMFRSTRCNPNGVDLMRNSPTEAKKASFLIGGHSLSPLLPWYRGKCLEKETLALMDFVKLEMFDSKISIALDIHSGFGFQDRLWYPYAHNNYPFERMDLIQNLIKFININLPYHVYLMESQASNYTTHGDIWDFLSESFYKNSSNIFLPWTLEMGSWIWMKKNPIQLFFSKGYFNPIKSHRAKRIVRRHNPLLHLLLKATKNHFSWSLTRSDNEKLMLP